MIELNQLSFSYERESPLIRNLSLVISSAEFFGIIGPNGSGKSTLLKLICGLLRPDKGEIRINGASTTHTSRKKLAQKVSAVLQDFSPVYDFSVQDIVHMGRIPYHSPFSEQRVEDYQIVRKAIEQTQLNGFEKRQYYTLSGGEKQRTIIAKCFAQQTPVILLDEFIAHLDLGHIQQVLQTVSYKNQKERITIVGVFHDINIAALYCDRICVLNHGDLECIGTPEEVIRKELLQSVFSAQCEVIDHPVLHKPQVVLL